MAATLAGSRQYGAYLEVVEMKQWLGFTSTAPDQTDAPLQRIIDMCCTAVQRRINRPVGAQEFWERHDGWSGEYILLKESPFIELVSCQEWQSSGGFVTLAESTPENPIDGIQIDYATSRVMRTFAGYSWPRPFFPGSRNIEFKYLAGYNPVPGDVWFATAEWVADLYRNTQQVSAPRAPGLSAANEYDSPDTRGVWKGMPHWVESAILPLRKVGVA